MYNDTYGAWTGSQTRWLNPDCYAGINMSERHQREDFSFWPGVQTSPAVDMANPVVSSASERYPVTSCQDGRYGDIIHTNTDETIAHRYEQQLFTGNFLFCGTSPSSQDFLKWKASNHHTAPDFSSISQDNMSNNVHDVLRHGSTGSAGSFRSNGGGSGVNSPTAPNNTPLVIPQPVKPATKAGKTYQCKMCDQIFHTKSDMLIHSQQIHKQDPKPYHCPQCQKCFANSSYLSQHARIHAGIKPYKCEICERKFTQLSHLQQHIRTHTGEKPYKCSHPSCGKAFSQLSNLQSHSRSHMTDKPYRCNSCYKCYADEQSLREHIPKHSDTKHLKTHICKICGKSYTQETYLARHMTKHAQDNNSTPKFSSRQIKQEPLEHSSETDFPHLNDGACTPCPPGKPSSAFMPIPQFGSATGSNNVNYPYSSGLGSNSFTTSLPQISSIAPPRYFPYDPLGFKRSEPTERNLNVSMTTRPENMLANSLLSLQHIKNYASQQMPGFGPAGSGTGASSRI